ncbi:MAG: hypothetical protein JXB88_05165 [Spirochaetales bacterium]|nr:hypothetical protein [Spirochaetales bacterium]
MKREELEKKLLESAGQKAIIKIANEFKKKYGTVVTQPPVLSKLLVDKNKLTPAEIKLNDEDFFVEKKVQLGPDLIKKKPLDVLNALVSEYRKKPDIEKQLLIEETINKIIAKEKLDTNTTKIIDEAIKMLGTVVPGRTDIDSIWTRVYQHSNYNGRSYYINHGPGWVYRLIRSSTLRSASMHDCISSLYVDASSTEIGGTIVLFQHDRYLGRYSCYPTNPSSPSTSVWTSYVGNFMNDKTSSILVVRRFNNEFSLALGSFGLRDEIGDYVSSVNRISLRGTPVITWDLWPEGGSSHPNDNRRFIHLKIPVRVDVPNWFDYDAEIWYWLYPYINSAGSLNGYVAYYGCWVEGGVKSGSIKDRIMDALPDTVSQINTRLQDAMALANLFGPFSRQYFMPGTGSNTGNTSDDVTLVLVKR